MKRLIILWILLLLLAGCGVSADAAPLPGDTAPDTQTSELESPTVAEPEFTPPTTVETEPTPPPSAAELLLARMTLREKVGQLFIVRPDALDPSLPIPAVSDDGTPGIMQVTDVIRQSLQTYPVGGVVLFSKNIANPEQVTALNVALQDASGIPLFLAVDEEGGIVARLARCSGFSLPRYASAAAVGAQGSDAAEEMGRTIGSYLFQYGFNMDFAPVADVNTNPANSVIGSRAFSPDPVQAALLARSMADGLAENGIIPVFKHFPGHGNTAEDSHVGLAVSHKTAEELWDCEFLPFLEAESQDCIMVGHIALPEVTGDSTPATLSPAVIRDLLKTQLGFQGLVITDSLEMGAIQNQYPGGQAAVMALQAGCDLILMPRDLGQAFEAVLSAVESGSLTQQQLDETVLRILRFKELHGIL